MPRILRRTVLVVALLGAWAFVGQNHAPLPLTFQESTANAGTWDAAGHESPDELAKLRVFSKVVLYLKDNYVDPRRIHPKEMMVQSLEYVEKTVPEVMVDGSAKSGHLKLDVDGHVRDWDISRVDSLWKMSFTMKDIFSFLAHHLRRMDDTKDVEYAAINGMLSTLDPHSILLRPEIYRDLQASTKGEFGGIGFVIQMREGNLTVVRVLPNTPASRAGIQKDDRIVKIGPESTVNMDVNDAVTKLRGQVGTQVTIAVARKGWKTPHPMTLTRAQIALASVLHKLLDGKVGYIRLKNFQGNTTHDMWEAIEDLKAQAGVGGLKGLVLDLRGNPGGLLEQAVQVVDTFVSHGTIVSTVGFSDRMREDKRAHDDDTDVHLPMAVLVNAGSASASEIVAGALKNLNRATIIGQQTFGKGSVQMLYEFPDNSALKLTIAKYLTPGDVSIQEIGIEPDVALVPTRVTPDQINVFAPRKSIGEADLSHHFGNPDSHHLAKSREDVLGKQKPFEQVRYLKASATVAQKDKKDKNQDDDADASADPTAGVLTDTDQGLYDELDAEFADKVKEDYEVRFARDYVLHAASADRLKQLAMSKGWVLEQRSEERSRIQKAITALGVDWTQGTRPKTVDLTAQLLPGPNEKLAAGSVLDLALTATNRGTQPLERVRAWTHSDDDFLDRREFLLGRLAPGQSRTWKVPIQLPKDLTTRREDLTVKFYDDQGPLGTQTVSELDFIGAPRPSFAFNWQVVDDCKTCNGDGIADEGEHLRLLLDVTNTGPGKAPEASAQISNGADEHVFIDDGRFKIGELLPGQTKTVQLTFDLTPGYAKPTFPLELAVSDNVLHVYTSEKITLPVGTKPHPVLAHRGWVRLSPMAQLFPTAEAARPIAEAVHGGTVALTGTVDGFDRVEIAPDRFAFVARNDAHPTRRHGKASLQALFYREPPKIAVNVSTADGGLVARGDSFTLSGTATDPKGLLDLYILVNDQKVAFETAPAGKDAPTRMKFSSTFPLKEGNNYVMVVARETPEFSGTRVLVIRRRPQAIAAALARENEALPDTARGRP